IELLNDFQEGENKNHPLVAGLLGSKINYKNCIYPIFYQPMEEKHERLSVSGDNFVDFKPVSGLYASQSAHYSTH
ncbi:MAG: hypothetical protein ACK4SN_13630, partial [Bellilinea sp.]